MLTGAISMIFIDNKYTRCYFNIISRAQSRTDNNGYCEKHHIIPKSLNGSDLKENLVLLTPKEHFICHLLLPKMTFGNNQKKMIFASNMMLCGKNRYVPCSRIYSKVREEFSKTISATLTGRTQPDEANQKRSLSQKGISKGPKTPEHKKNISLALTGRTCPNKGKTLSTKGKSYEEIYGKETTDNLLKIRSKAWKGRKGFQKSGKDNPNAKSIEINGIIYETMKDACNSLDITYYELHKLIS